MAPQNALPEGHGSNPRLCGKSLRGGGAGLRPLDQHKGHEELPKGHASSEVFGGLHPDGKGPHAGGRALDMTPEPEQGPEKPAGPEGLLAVRHNLTGVLHRAGSMAGPPQTYGCGWKWAAAGCAGAFTTSDGTPCSRCYDVTK